MNWKYILIFLILTIIVAGGIFAYLYLWEPKDGSKMTEIESPIITSSNETTDWTTYRSGIYGIEFKYPTYTRIFSEYNPIYRDEEGSPPLGDGALYYFNDIWGPIIPSRAVFDFEFINPSTEKLAEAIGIRLRILNLIDYRSPSYYFGPVAYSSDENRWYKAEILQEIIEEAVVSEPLAGNREIPNIFMFTKEQVPIYQITVYGDVGYVTTNYVIIDDKRNMVAEFSKSSSGNDYDMSSEANRKFVDEISKDFIKILESFSF